MTWFAFKGYNNGQAVDIAGSQEKQAVSIGFHGYGTEKQAEANPNSVDGDWWNPLSYAQKTFVNEIVVDYKAATAEGAQPGGPNANIKNPVTAAKAVTKGATTAAADAAKAVLGNITGGITGFSGTNFVLRALKVVVGGVLVIVGFMRMTGADNAITKVASKVPIIPL